MSSYYYWVKKKIGEDSPIGDLARDIMLEQARYRSFPINSQSFRRLLGHFETKYENANASEAFCDSWGHYKYAQLRGD